MLFRSEAGWKEPYEPQGASSVSPPATALAGTATAVAGRALTVEERQAQAKQDIAAAKARESAFAGQGTRQFTDSSIAQPDTPIFGSSGPRPSSADRATDTFELRDSTPESEKQRPTDTAKLPSDTAGSTADSATDTFQLGDGRGASEDQSPTGTIMLDSDVSAASSQQQIGESDRSKPLSTRGRANFKPSDANDTRNAKTKAQPESQGQSQQALSSQPASDQAIERLQDTGDDTAADGRPAPVYEPDTSKPLYAKGRADLKPQNMDEQNARAKAEAELKQRSRQTVTPEVSATEPVSKLKQSEPAPASTAAPAAADQSAAKTKPIAGGRAPDGKHDAREKAMAELKKESQQQQPVKEVPNQMQEQMQPSQQQPSSEPGQTADLAEGFAEASTAAEPLKAKGQATPPDKRQPGPFQAQQAASSMSTADSTPASLSPAQQPQNPLENLVSAFQGLLGGKPSPISSPSSILGTAQQAQSPAGDASAAQRMAASNQVLAAGKGEGRIRRQVPVKRYSEVTLEGSVTEFVRERGLRAPLLLLAGLAASAAQTLEPLWPVS